MTRLRSLLLWARWLWSTQFAPSAPDWEQLERPAHRATGAESHLAAYDTEQRRIESRFDHP